MDPSGYHLVDCFFQTILNIDSKGMKGSLTVKACIRGGRSLFQIALDRQKNILEIFSIEAL